MLSKTRSGKKSGGSSRLLTELEFMNKTFNAENAVPRLASSTASSRSKSIEKSNLTERRMKQEDAKRNSKDSSDKRSSIWSWKGLKALTHTRNQRFSCCFTLLVHSIECLPPFFNEGCLVVHWKQRGGDQITYPVRVSDGVAKFEEQLTFSCSVYGSRSGPHHSAKYEAKHFLLYASLHDAPELDLGKHRIDLTRLLPLTLEELMEEKSFGNWSTSFRLSGKARGAVLNVTFGYKVIDNSNSSSADTPSWNRSVPEIPTSQQNRTPFMEISDQRNDVFMSQEAIASARLLLSGKSRECRQKVSLKPSNEIYDSVNLVYQKLDEETRSGVQNELEFRSISSPINLENVKSSDEQPGKSEAYVCEAAEFSMAEERMDDLKNESSESEPSNIGQLGEGIGGIDTLVDMTRDEDALENLSLAGTSGINCEQSTSYQDHEEKIASKDLIMIELEEALMLNSELLQEGLEFEDEKDTSYMGKYLEYEYNFDEHSDGMALGMEDFSDLVANDFLEMLGLEGTPSGLNSDSEPESPRERLLREFEKDALANGDLFNLDVDVDDDDDPFTVHRELPYDFRHSSAYEGLTEMPNLNVNHHSMKTSASAIEDLENEALMREWSIDEKAFQCSPPKSSPSEFDTSQLPPLEEDGLSPLMQLKNGGFLRSMNPDLFKSSKSGGSLIMQVSNPVVVPAEMGSGTMDILQGLASVGIEKLSMQANKLMPLEDIMGKTVQQVAWEGPQRQELLVPASNKFGSNSLIRGDTEYVSLEDLAPLAMDKIEALSIEGLRIQCGMTDEDAPSNISTQSVGELSALKGKNATTDVCGSLGLDDGTCGLQLMDVKLKDGQDDVDGLMALSLTLEEWMKLDSGEIDLTDEQTSKILAAHHATSLDQFRGRSKGEKKRRGRKCGLLGNNFTVALMVQLHNPLRNYESVGAPMLALIQVERVFVPPKPKIYSTVSMAAGETHGRSSSSEPVTETVEQEEVIIPQYKISEVHVAGLNVVKDGKKKLWGGSKNQQSSSRWLLANGMGKKTNKHPLLKSKPGDDDTLWSISSSGLKNSHIRKPNIFVRV